MAWIYLAFAIVLEVAGTTFMKLSNGFENALPSVLVFVFYALSFSAMIIALKGIDLSVAYAIWAGAGTALIGVIGVLWFREPLTILKMISMALIVIGVIGLNLSGSGN